jgi:hypothetical protein
MTRVSTRRLVVAVLVVVVITFLFRGAGHWLVDTMATMHGRGGPH